MTTSPKAAEYGTRASLYADQRASGMLDVMAKLALHERTQVNLELARAWLAGQYAAREEFGPHVVALEMRVTELVKMLADALRGHK